MDLNPFGSPDRIQHLFWLRAVDVLPREVLKSSGILALTKQPQCDWRLHSRCSTWIAADARQMF